MGGKEEEDQAPEEEVGHRRGQPNGLGPTTVGFGSAGEG